MRVFILGAGASRHAGYPLTAELTRELVAWLEDHAHESRHFQMGLDALRGFGLNRGLDDIEEILEDAGKSIKGLPIALCDSIEGFFNEVRRRPVPSSGYATFASIGCRPGDVVITFNYDDALERALKSAGKWDVWNGYGFSVSADYSQSPVEVLKLHGSVNWWASLFGGRMGYSMFDPQHTLGHRPVIADHHMQALGYAQERDRECPPKTAKVQVMIAPFRKKQFFYETSFGTEYGGFYDDLWRRAEAALSRATTVYVLGYGMAQSDVRARELILGSISRSTPVRLFCGSRGGTLAEKFRREGFSDVQSSSTRFEKIDWASLAPERPSAGRNEHGAILGCVAGGALLTLLPVLWYPPWVGRLLAFPGVTLARLASASDDLTAGHGLVYGVGGTVIWAGTLYASRRLLRSRRSP